MDLRSNKDEGATSAPNHPTIEFARRVEDGLGGSLNSIWGSRVDEEGAERKDPGLIDHFGTRSGQLVDPESVGDDGYASLVCVLFRSRRA